MDIFYGILIWVGVFIAYFLVEFIINLFFTYKIKHVTEGDYNKAAIAGSISTFLFMFSTLIAAVLGTSLVGGEHSGELFSRVFADSKILIIIWTTLGLAVGNFCATISIPVIEKKIKKNKEKGNKI